MMSDQGRGGTVSGRAGSVVSEDGTRIGYRRTGEGPPLVLVHGTSADHARWAPVLPALAERFAVYAIDRRGQAGSGDAKDHSLEREAEDVTAVVDAAGGAGGGPVRLLGHSYGAICCLEAVSRRPASVEGLVLYEPPLPTGAAAFPAEAVGRVEALIEGGDTDEAMAVFLREVAGMPPPQVDRMRAEPDWPKRVAAAHTLPREARAAEGYALDPARLQELRTRTLLLLGGESPPLFEAATDALDEALPDSCVVVMPGQGHTWRCTRRPSCSRAWSWGSWLGDEPHRRHLERHGRAVGKGARGMHVLQIEYPVPDYAAWKAAFDRDLLDREGSGVRRYRVLRPTDDPNYVLIDLEFESADEAEAYLGALRRQFYSSRQASPAPGGGPKTRIAEVAEAKEY